MKKKDVERKRDRENWNGWRERREFHSDKSIQQIINPSVDFSIQIHVCSLELIMKAIKFIHMSVNTVTQVYVVLPFQEYVCVCI